MLNLLLKVEPQGRVTQSLSQYSIPESFQQLIREPEGRERCRESQSGWPPLQTEKAPMKEEALQYDDQEHRVWDSDPGFYSHSLTYCLDYSDLVVYLSFLFLTGLNGSNNRTCLRAQHQVVVKIMHIKQISVTAVFGFQGLSHHSCSKTTMQSLSPLPS